MRILTAIYVRLSCYVAHNECYSLLTTYVSVFVALPVKMQTLVDKVDTSGKGVFIVTIYAVVVVFVVTASREAASTAGTTSVSVKLVQGDGICG